MPILRRLRTLIAQIKPNNHPSTPKVEYNGLRPRIGLAGSFNRGNYGDELYVLTYRHWFGDWADLFLLTGLENPPYFSDFGKAFARQVDAVVLGGGDLLCPYRSNISKDFINPTYLRRPVHVAGIGVERNKPEIDPDVVARWKDFLTDPAIRSISTRDPGSTEWIETHIAPRVPVGTHPDLVCALPLPPAQPPEGAPILGLVTRHIKHPKEYVLAAEAARALMARGWRVRHIIGGVGPHGAKDAENARHMDVPGKEIVHVEDLDAISRAIGECSLVFSMKLHTTLVSVMYGVPTISLNPVVKARAFMKAAGYGDLVLAHDDRRLMSLIEGPVPPPPPEAVARLRAEASDVMRALGQRLWDGFRESHPAHALPEAAPLPKG